MPGYAKCFKDIFDSNIALVLARDAGSSIAIQQAGVKGLAQILQKAKVRFQRRSLPEIVAWADSAPPCDQESEIHHRIWTALEDDRAAKTLKIAALERDLAMLLVKTPYVLLMGLPGVNVVSASEFAGEMGPIQHYGNARAITGRAGLFPSRYQSDLVDQKNGPIVRRANRSLRNAILIIADNLIVCNDHFRGLADRWKKLGKDARDVHIKVAGRFCRIAYQMVAGQQVFQHPSYRHRDYILEKLIAFYREHDTDMLQVLAGLKLAVDQLPRSAYQQEAAPLVNELAKVRGARCRGPQQLGDILPVVLAKLGVDRVESTTTTREQDPH
jgi:hypothetical protein